MRRALAGVARVKGGAGMQAVASMLVGESNERVRRMGLDRLSTFGVLEGKSHDEAMSILRALLANAWIDLTTGEFPVPPHHAGGLARDARRGAHAGAAPGPRCAPAAATRSAGRVARRARRRPRPRGRARSRPRRRSRPQRPATTRRAPRRAPPPRLRAQAEPGVEIEEHDVPLLEAPRAHRAALAKEKVAARLRHRARPDAPGDRGDPARVARRPALAHGMGQAKISSYGEGILRVVREFSGP